MAVRRAVESERRERFRPFAGWSADRVVLPFVGDCISAACVGIGAGLAVVIALHEVLSPTDPNMMSWIHMSAVVMGLIAGARVFGWRNHRDRL